MVFWVQYFVKVNTQHINGTNKPPQVGGTYPKVIARYKEYYSRNENNVSSPQLKKYTIGLGLCENVKTKSHVTKRPNHVRAYKKLDYFSCCQLILWCNLNFLQTLTQLKL